MTSPDANAGWKCPVCGKIVPPGQSTFWREKCWDCWRKTNGKEIKALLIGGAIAAPVMLVAAPLLGAMGIGLGAAVALGARSIAKEVTKK